MYKATTTDLTSVEHVSDSFLEHCRSERHLSLNTLAAYAQDLAEFRRFLGARVGINAVTSELVVAYRDYLLRARGAALATAKRRLACLRALFRWRARRDSTLRSPFTDLGPLVRLPSRLPRCLETTEVRALLVPDGAASDDRLVTGILVATGMRVSELAALRIPRIDLQTGSLRIVGKGDRERTVYVTDARMLDMIAGRVRAALTRGEDSLFCSRSGRPRSARWIRARVVVTASKSGIARRVTPHMLRHTAATLLMERGVDVRIVQRLLGHRSILTTQLYLHVSDATLRSAMARADVLASYGEVRP